MAEEGGEKPPRPKPSDARRQRLEAELRANLARRKAAARQRRQAENPGSSERPATGPGGNDSSDA